MTSSFLWERQTLDFNYILKSKNSNDKDLWNLCESTFSIAIFLVSVDANQLTEINPRKEGEKEESH